MVGQLRFSAAWSVVRVDIRSLSPQNSQTVIRTLTTVVDAFTWPIDDDYLLRPEIRFVLIHDATSVTAKPRWLLNVPRLSQATPRP